MLNREFKVVYKFRYQDWSMCLRRFEITIPDEAIDMRTHRKLFVNPESLKGYSEEDKAAFLDPAPCGPWIVAPNLLEEDEVQALIHRHPAFVLAKENGWPIREFEADINACPFCDTIHESGTFDPIED